MSRARNTKKAHHRTEISSALSCTSSGVVSVDSSEVEGEGVVVSVVLSVAISVGGSVAVEVLFESDVGMAGEGIGVVGRVGR